MEPPHNRGLCLTPTPRQSVHKIYYSCKIQITAYSCSVLELARGLAAAQALGGNGGAGHQIQQGGFMKKGGISLVFVLCVAVGAQSIFAQEPPRNLTPDEIQRIMEQERLRRFSRQCGYLCQRSIHRYVLVWAGEILWMIWTWWHKPSRK